LIVDEINRGNLPRIFGELLFLLEYRDQAMILPYSKRPFRLPSNLFLIATMNPLDHSAVAFDQALRRRFSFVDMPADAAILASWLERNPPSSGGDETFGPHVVRVFEELNARLARDLGSDKQVGHSFFMIPDLNPEKLTAIWEHHVRPMLLDHFGGREERLRQYTLERVLSVKPRRTNSASRATSE
jgi:5-methylcytosine-specific restriction endonuclease McrBC GTP-binding regulatory subunit McrB